MCIEFCFPAPDVLHYVAEHAFTKRLFHSILDWERTSFHSFLLKTSAAAIELDFEAEAFVETLLDLDGLIDSSIQCVKSIVTIGVDYILPTKSSDAAQTVEAWCYHVFFAVVSHEYAGINSWTSSKHGYAKKQ